MAKKNVAVVIVVIILVLAGLGAFYYMGWFEGGSSKKKDDNGGGGGTTNIAPNAFFSGNTTGTVGERLEFSANGSSDKDGYIKIYEWDFGDGTGKEQMNITEMNHTFNIAGIFKINLTVIDDRSAQGSYSQEITIRPQDYNDGSTTFLILRFGIDTLNETIPVEEFAASMEINVSFTGASINGYSVQETTLEVTIYNPFGSIIAKETRRTRGNSNSAFYFYEKDLMIQGDYEMEAKCLQGALVLEYEISVRYY